MYTIFIIHIAKGKADVYKNLALFSVGVISSQDNCEIDIKPKYIIIFRPVLLHVQFNGI